jgi:hypothetical protein
MMLMEDLFSRRWCETINSGIVLSVASVATTRLTSSPSGAAVPVRVLVRVRHPSGNESRGLMTLTPWKSPFVRFDVDGAEDAWEAEIEIPLEVLRRMSERPLAESMSDVQNRAMTRVHVGMEHLLELGYRYGSAPGLQDLRIPTLA